MTFTTETIVLGYENRGEADRVYHLYTDKFGKIDALAKGSQKILSKIGPHLELPVISRVLIAKGRMGDRIAGSEIKKSYRGIRNNFSKREILFFCFEMVVLSTRPEGADEGVYKFLEEFMDVLEKTPDALNKGNRISIIISFLLRFFSLIGFHPNFDKSNLSKEKVENWVSGILDKPIKI